MTDILVRSAILRAAVGALGGILLVGGAFAAFTGATVPGVAGAILGAALTVFFMLAERRANRGESVPGYSTDALRELGAILDPREPVGPSGYEPGARVTVFVVLFAFVLILLRKVGLPAILGFLHGVTGLAMPDWEIVLSWLLLPLVAAVIAGSTFVLIHRRAFLWLEFRRIVTASAITTASAIVGSRLAVYKMPTPERPDDVAWVIGHWIAALLGIVGGFFLTTLISLALCAVGYLLVNTVSRSAFAAGSAAPEDNDWSDH